jgi:23S rRNA pseudouridine2605 synthase
MQERLQKIIARAGIASRRAAEELVTSGRIRVNGRVITELGTKADPRNDKIELDGTRIIAEDFVYVVLHKPRNVVSTMSDPEGRPTVATLLKGAGGRDYPVGRLDFATSGVLLATNDGDFANGLLHPKGGVPKTYVVKAMGLMTDPVLDAWRKGVELEDGKTAPAQVKLIRYEGDKTWFEVTLREGRNQQIRRMGEATGHRVMRLARVSFAGVTHEGIRPGEWRSLTMDELKDLREAFGVPKRVRRGPATHSPPAPRGPRPRTTSQDERRPARPKGSIRSERSGRS